MAEQLIGKVVALDPEKCPEGFKDRLGQPAIVKSIYEDGKTALISFGDDVICGIPFDSLIMLKPHNSIVNKLIRNWNIPTEDFQAAIQVTQYYHNRLFVYAMNAALANDNVRKICTVNCEEWFNKNLKQNKNQKRLR